MAGVIKYTEDNIEFFTVNETGESGMSISGLARICGITKQSVEQLLTRLEDGRVRADTLKRFIGKPLWVEVDGIPVRGQDNDKVVKDKVCAAVIDYYAFDSSQVNEEQQAQAIFAHRRFAEIGVQSWIQGITGWRNKKTDFQVSDFVMDTPLVWNKKDKPFPPEFYEQIYRLRGWNYNDANRKGHPGCVGTWTNKFVYEKFPEGVSDTLTKKYVDFNKKRKKYEFLTLEEGRNHLEKHMVAVITAMRLSPAGKWKKFLKNLETAIPDADAIRFIQLEFSFLSELEESNDDD